MNKPSYFSFYRKSFNALEQPLCQLRQNKQRRKYYLHYSNTADSNTTNENRAKSDSYEILTAGINAVNPKEAVKRYFYLEKNGTILLTKQWQENKKNSKIKRYNLSTYRSILCVGFGKASSTMMEGVIETLSSGSSNNHQIKGIIITKDDHVTKYQEKILSDANVLIREASHPIPDERCYNASFELLKLLETHSSHDTLVVICVSGGGSSLFCTPKPPLTLQDLIRTNQALIESGIPIQDINTIRKCCELGKGGGLLNYLSKEGNVITLVLSDVIGDDLGSIAAGPTTPSLNKFGNAKKIISRVPLLKERLPQTVLELIHSSNDVKEDNNKMEYSLDTVLVGNNEMAVVAAARKAEELGYYSFILTCELQGEARIQSCNLLSMAEYLVKQNSQYRLSNNSSKIAVFAGGETTVTLSSKDIGKGGRNQEFGLVAAIELQSSLDLNSNKITLTSIGTDGTDGPTDAAGVIVDSRTIPDKFIEDAVLALESHDAYTFFSKLEAVDKQKILVKLGATGTNVADIYFILINSH